MNLRDTLTVIDLAAFGLQLVLQWSRVPKYPLVSLTVGWCPRQGGRRLRLWRWSEYTGY